MKRFTESDVRLEAWVRGPLFIADTDAARANKAMLERHFLTEWNSDIDATMATIHPEGPWQRITALRIDVNGFEAVREYYLKRFDTWPGPAMHHFDRTTIVDGCILVEGTLQIEPRGEFGGRPAKGSRFSAPAVIVVDFKDGLILGETVYVDGASLQEKGKSDGGRSDG